MYHKWYTMCHSKQKKNEYGWISQQWNEIKAHTQTESKFVCDMNMCDLRCKAPHFKKNCLIHSPDGARFSGFITTDKLYIIHWYASNSGKHVAIVVVKLHSNKFIAIIVATDFRSSVQIRNFHVTKKHIFELLDCLSSNFFSWKSHIKRRMNFMWNFLYVL